MFIFSFLAFWAFLEQLFWIICQTFPGSLFEAWSRAKCICRSSICQCAHSGCICSHPTRHVHYNGVQWQVSGIQFEGLGLSTGMVLWFICESLIGNLNSWSCSSSWLHVLLLGFGRDGDYFTSLAFYICIAADTLDGYWCGSQIPAAGCVGGSFEGFRHWLQWMKRPMGQKLAEIHMRFAATVLAIGLMSGDTCWIHRWTAILWLSICS